MIWAIVFLAVLGAALVVAVALPLGSLPIDHDRDVPPLTHDEMDAAEDALDATEGRP